MLPWRFLVTWVLSNGLVFALVVISVFFVVQATSSIVDLLGTELLVLAISFGLAFVGMRILKRAFVRRLRRDVTNKGMRDGKRDLPKTQQFVYFALFFCTSVPFLVLARMYAGIHLPIGSIGIMLAAYAMVCYFALLDIKSS